MLVVIVLVVTAACRIGFESLSGDAPASDDDTLRDDGRADICENALMCESYDSALGTGSTFGDVAWLAGAGRAGGGARARATPSQAAIALYKWTSPITAGSLHARAYVKITAGAPIGSYLVLVQLDNDEDTLGLEKVSADLSAADRWTIAAPFASIDSRSMISAPRESWICVELAIDITPTNGRLRVLVGGNEIVNAGPANTLVPGGFLQLAIGASTASDDPEIEAFFDDVVVAQQPIGC